jgi:MFS family permease
LVVRYGGLTADRWGSRVPVVIGLSVLASVAAMLSQLPPTAPLWQVCLILALSGLGSGLTLAALHRSAMSNVVESEMGSVAGMYSMVRFAGMVMGTAVAGVLLQRFLDQTMSDIQAYQATFLFFACASLIGIAAGFALREPE